MTIVDTLRYTFAPSDHGQTVRCITTGSWIDVEQDEYFASYLLDVMFFPEPQDPIAQYGFIEGQSGNIAVNFTSNPQPTRAWWTLEDNDKIDVPTELNNFSAPNQPSNYEAQPLKPVNDSQFAYEAVLHLKTITKQHADMVYRLSVESDLNDKIHKQEYTVQISFDSAPLFALNVVASIVGIVMVVIVISCVVAWCPPDCSGYTFTGTGSRVDDENTIGKEREQQVTQFILKENYPDLLIFKNL